jgi:hypothetical protein
MKTKRRIIYIGIALWLIAFLQMIETAFQSTDAEQEMITAFSDNNFLSTVSTITASGSCSNTYFSSEEREEFLLNMAHSLGVSTGLVYDCVTEDGVTTSSLVRTGDNATTVLKLITTEKSVSSHVVNLKNLVTVTISFENSLESAFYYKDLLKQTFADAEISPDITIQLKGNIKGELSMSEKNVIADKFLESAGGEIVTESRKDDLFTIYAYTDRIEEYVLSGSMKTNLNVVISYDEINDVTEVSMATPFLEEDF